MKRTPHLQTIIMVSTLCKYALRAKFLIKPKLCIDDGLLISPIDERVLEHGNTAMDFQAKAVSHRFT